MLVLHFNSLTYNISDYLSYGTFVTLGLDYSWALWSALFGKLPDLTVVRGVVIYFRTSEGFY